MGKIVITFGIEKLECVATRRWKKTEDRPMFTRFERDGRTDGQTPHDGMGRAYA